MNNKPSQSKQICTRCVMDTTDSAITFTSEGVCDHCLTYDREIVPDWDTGEKGNQQLTALVNRIKQDGKKRDFDCIMGMSGGADSSYLLYKVVHDFGLRPLVFHVDAGWNSQSAVNNIEKLVDGLGLDLFTEVIDWEEMKDLQLAFFRAGVSHTDTPQDHAFFATMYKFAAKYNIRYILTGANYSTECIQPPFEWMYFQSDSTQLRDIHRRFGQRPLKKFPITNILWHKLYLPFVRGIKVVRPLNYFPYVKEEAMQLLQEKFGWQVYPQKHFESRFTRFYESYWLSTRFGFDVRIVQYSSLILTGQMTRDEALKKLEACPYDQESIHTDCEFVANKLGITTDELESYRTMSIRSSRDYKSQRFIYAGGAAVMRILGWEKGGKR